MFSSFLLSAQADFSADDFALIEAQCCASPSVTFPILSLLDFCEKCACVLQPAIEGLKGCLSWCVTVVAVPLAADRGC